MKLIPLSRGLFAKVSNRDYKFLMQWKWSVHVSGRQGKLYAGRGRGTKDSPRILMHRVILPTDLDVDHKNNDGLDNRRKNLRARTRSQNCHGARSDNHSMQGIRKRGKRYKASVMVDYVRYHKTFDDPIAAQAWRRSMKP